MEQFRSPGAHAHGFVAVVGVGAVAVVTGGALVGGLVSPGAAVPLGGALVATTGTQPVPSTKPMPAGQVAMTCGRHTAPSNVVPAGHTTWPALAGGFAAGPQPTTINRPSHPNRMAPSYQS
jgi:hypothetical protein